MSGHQKYPLLDDVAGNEDKGYGEENSKDELVEEIVEETAEEEDLYKDTH